MAETCPKCGRPSWRSHGGMGGGIMPDAETHCLQRGGLWCRVAAAGYRAGIDEGVRLAKEHAGIAWCSEVDAGIDWTDVDKAAAAAKGDV